MLLPTTCPGCGDAVPVAPCMACIGALRPPPPASDPDGVDALVVLGAYDGIGRALVTALKYRNDRAALAWMAAALADLARDPCQRAGVGAVTWAPTTRARAAARGFDQAEVLARAVARRLHLPARRLLRRAPGGDPQTGRSLAERLDDGPVFTVERRPPPAVLVVDDVVTSGATIAAAARALRADGARVIGAAAARTPARSYTSP